MGYCLVADISLQKFAVFYGVSRGGKGTISDVLSNMVGQSNIAAPALPNLATNSALEEMSTKSLTLIPDAHSVASNNRDLVLSTLKAITGGDKVSFHEMYKGSRNTVFKTKVVLSTNNMPQFNDPSGALVNRMLVFPFLKSFAGREDFTLGEKLKKKWQVSPSGLSKVYVVYVITMVSLLKVKQVKSKKSRSEKVCHLYLNLSKLLVKWMKQRSLT